jgi:hypothetical protein
MANTASSSSAKQGTSEATVPTGTLRLQLSCAATLMSALGLFVACNTADPIAAPKSTPAKTSSGGTANVTPPDGEGEDLPRDRSDAGRNDSGTSEPVLDPTKAKDIPLLTMCESTTTFNACFACCDGKEGRSNDEFDTTLQICACNAQDGLCKTECQNDLCAGKSGSTTACQNCINTAGSPCKLKAEAACSNKVACNAFLGCFWGSKCNEKN